MGVSPSTAAPQSDGLKRFTFTQYHMGVDARLVVYAKDQTTAEKACSAAFDRIGDLDGIMSDYRKDSELNRLCDKAGGPPVAVSRDLFLVLSRSMELSKRSSGAFDITVGPLIKLWRATRKSGVLPTQAEIDLARRLVGYHRIILDPKRQTIKLTAPGIRLDLGGIAKGYAGDEAIKVLKGFGVTRALVELGGDIVVSGPPPGKKGWAIRVPNAAKDKGPVDMEFANCGVSSSGDTEQFVEINGVKYSHVVDPRTGWALTSRTQATVVARRGLTTDPLSTAMTVCNEKERRKLLRSYRVSKTFVKVVRD